MIGKKQRSRPFSVSCSSSHSEIHMRYLGFYWVSNALSDDALLIDGPWVAHGTLESCAISYFLRFQKTVPLPKQSSLWELATMEEDDVVADQALLAVILLMPSVHSSGFRGFWGFIFCFAFIGAIYSLLRVLDRSGFFYFLQLKHIGI